jgi:MoxR-like ATPase
MAAGKEEILSFQTTVERIREQIGREIVGQKEVIDHLLMALVAGGLLLEYLLCS